LLSLQKGIPGIKNKNLIYFRDLYDHVIELVDSEEVLRDILTGALDSYLSAASNRMNEIMKTLTVIATIMLPLTLITGIYGMNFSYMPELYHPAGYFGTMAFMLILGVLMLLYFRKRGWF
jgi:magnesium transporter